MQKLYEYPGFLFVNSDLFNHTPNLQVDILRDQAKLYGVSETRILNAAAQRLFAELHLSDQEAQRPVSGDPRSERTRTASDPQNLDLLYIKSDDGQRMVPLERGDHVGITVLGPQSVNHINQFTSVTLFFNLKPGYTIGAGHRSSWRTAATADSARRTFAAACRARR